MTEWRPILLAFDGNWTCGSSFRKLSKGEQESNTGREGKFPSFNTSLVGNSSALVIGTYTKSLGLKYASSGIKILVGKISEGGYRQLDSIKANCGRMPTNKYKMIHR